MFQLFLSEPALGNDGNEKSAKERISLLKKLESIIWLVMTSGGRSEARLWLCTTISSINSISLSDQRELFIDLLRYNPSKRSVAAQLMQIIFEKRPQKAGLIIAKKGYILEKFFKGNPRRILQWFGNFASSGESGHRKGARALSKFAFVNRDICWEELEWKGKHGQSPAMVATKPHYFLDLDVLRTVENFLEYVPDFWSSDELAESLKDGEIFNVDMKFFVQQFVHLMYGEKSVEVWEAINEFLLEESFTFLCHHLLILLDEHELCTFLNSVRKLLPARMQCKDSTNPSYWLEILLSTCNDYPSVDEFLLLNAVINHGRQLLRLVYDDEHREEKRKIEELLLETSTISSEAEHWELMKECKKLKKLEAIKWLGIQSWVLHYILSEKCKTTEAYESLFMRNGICFRRSNEYSLVRADAFFTRNGSDLNDEGLTRSERKKMKSRKKKKRKKNYSHDESSEDELLELETSSGQPDLQSGSGSWKLSTDNYSCPWNIVDIPEHLSKYCFSIWMKSVCSQWSSSA